MLRKLIAVTALLWAGLAGAEPETPEYAGQDIEHWYQTVSTLPPAGLSTLEGQRFIFAVDLENSPGFSLDYDRDMARTTLTYRMAFNNVAEGWSWEPLADPETADYYLFKFLPLKTTYEEKGAPATVELYPGKMVEVRNIWRYDYFLAFPNLYDFYPRRVDDDAGFGATVKGVPIPKESLVMLAVIRLKLPYHSESNTFWKADFAHPVDYTLRKRYLIGDLEEVRFVDRVSGRIYGVQKPMPK